MDQRTMSLIIDTDAGVDDAMAILMALAKPDCEVVAITTVSGNVHVDRVLSNVGIVLDVARAQEIPFYRGADRPLVGRPIDAVGVHGRDGLGDVGFPESRRAPQGMHAAVALVEIARRMEGQCTLVALGPLTNLALAVQLEPDLPRLLRGTVIMGGAFKGRGNVTPVAEFNVFCDPEAARVVFSSGFRPVVVSWDVALDTPVPWDEWDALLAKGEIGKRFVGPISARLRSLLAERGLDGMLVPDPLAMVAALEPGAVSLSDAWVDVEARGEVGRGLTVMGERLLAQRAPNARVALRVDGHALSALLERALEREAYLA